MYDGKYIPDQCLVHVNTCAVVVVMLAEFLKSASVK